MQVVHVERDRLEKLAASVEHYAGIFEKLEDAGWRSPELPAYGSGVLPLVHVGKALRRELEDG